MVLPRNKFFALFLFIFAAGRLLKKKKSTCIDASLVQVKQKKGLFGGIKIFGNAESFGILETIVEDAVVEANNRLQSKCCMFNTSAQRTLLKCS